jgi:serine/threonine-protein kinase
MEVREKLDDTFPPSGVSSLAPESGSGVVLRTDPIAPGEVIGGKYVVESVIGIGGVAIVLAARHLELEELVAIKILQPELQSRRDIVQRFSREARAAVRIKSEFAARIFDVGNAPGRGPYLVMEHLAGSDLGVVMHERGRLPAKRAVEFVMQACEALAVAHSQGIIHRDIKPENLFLATRPDGTELVKVLDFGISKAALTGSIWGGDESPLRTQELMGTPLYMSPEQIRSTANVDHRADIWSLGVVLYELITGQLAFHGEAITKICAAVLEQEPPPLATFAPDAPAGLQAVIDRCLQKDPAKRFQNVAELALALLPFGPSMARVFAERTSTILRASGQSAGVTFKFHSSAPPPSGMLEGDIRIPGAAPIPTMTSGAPVGMPSGMPTSGRPSGAPFEQHITNPEALNAIAVEGRRTRRMVVGVIGLVLVLAGVAVFVIAKRAPVVASSASTDNTKTAMIESDPPGARVEWNGKLLGDTPLTATLPIGAQSLVVTKDGFAPETLSVTVSSDDPAGRKTKITLKPANGSAPSVAVPKTSPSSSGAAAARGAAVPPFGARGPLPGPFPFAKTTAPAGAAPKPSDTAVAQEPAPDPVPVKVKTLSDSAPAPTTRVKVITDKKTNVTVVE